MIRSRHGMLTLLALFLLAAGCGQMGPLTLPEDAPTAPDDESDEENER